MTRSYYKRIERLSKIQWVFAAICGVSFIFLLFTAAASDLDAIGFYEIARRSVICIAAMLFGGYVIVECDYKKRKIAKQINKRKTAKSKIIDFCNEVA